MTVTQNSLTFLIYWSVSLLCTSVSLKLRVASSPFFSDVQTLEECTTHAHFALLLYNYTLLIQMVWSFWTFLLGTGCPGTVEF